MFWIIFLLAFASSCLANSPVITNCSAERVALQKGISSFHLGPPRCESCQSHQHCKLIGNVTALIGPVTDDYSMIASLVEFRTKNSGLSPNQVALVGVHANVTLAGHRWLIQAAVQFNELKVSSFDVLIVEEENSLPRDQCYCFERLIHHPIVLHDISTQSRRNFIQVLSLAKIPYYPSASATYVADCPQFSRVTLHGIEAYPQLLVHLKKFLRAKGQNGFLSENSNSTLGLRGGIVVSAVIPSTNVFFSLRHPTYFILISPNGYPHGFAYACKQLGIPFHHVLPQSNAMSLLELVKERLTEASRLCYDVVTQSAPKVPPSNFVQHTQMCHQWPETSVLPSIPTTSNTTVAMSYLAAPCGPHSELLYNGICLASPWPPQYSMSHFMKLSDQSPWAKWQAYDAVKPPYESQTRRVTPVHLNRQLFVDNFLIDELCSKRWTRTFHSFFRVGEFNLTSERLLSSVGNSVVPDISEKIVYFYYPRERTRGQKSKSSENPYELVRFAIPFDKINERLVFLLGKAQLTVHDDDPTSGVSRAFSVVLWKAGENCRFILFGAPLRRYDDRSLDVRCSPDGIRFKTVATNKGRVLDGHSVSWNPFRNLFMAGLRDNLLAYARVRRYAEFNNPLSPGQLWADFSICERNWSVPTTERVSDLTGLWSACHDNIDGGPTLQLTPVAEDPEYNNSWDNVFHNNQSAFRRISALYDFSATAYESLWVGTRFIHVGGRSIPKWNVPLLGFSRDGFHLSFPFPSEGKPFLVGPGYFTGSIVPSSHNDDSLIMAYLFNGNCFLENFCSQYWFAIRRDGFASLKPLPDERADLWTKWLSMPKLSTLYLNADIGTGGEIFPCFYPANKTLRFFCYHPVIGPKNSTSGIEFLLPDSVDPFVNVIFKLRFRLFGNVSLYSFWFHETTRV